MAEHECKQEQRVFEMHGQMAIFKEAVSNVSTMNSNVIDLVGKVGQLNLSVDKLSTEFKTVKDKTDTMWNGLQFVKFYLTPAVVVSLLGAIWGLLK